MIIKLCPLYQALGKGVIKPLYFPFPSAIPCLPSEEVLKTQLSVHLTLKIIIGSLHFILDDKIGRYQ